MSHTKSESLITQINTNVFFKEFTFDKNEFYPDRGNKKELADNILCLNNLLFVLQIKERNSEKAKGTIDSWFKNKILKKAKNQIKDTISFFNEYDSLPILNGRNQSIDIAKVNHHGIHKLIVYKTEETLNEKNKNVKFYESQDVGNIHILNYKDYYWICKYLHTPTELDEYLKFRERIYLKHKQIISIYPEQYILAHFLNTDDETIINPTYIETLQNLSSDINDFDISGILENFKESIIQDSQKEPFQYYSIIEEIAALKRYELLEFKKRLIQSIEDVKQKKLSPPYRFTLPRTECGFVFIPLMADKKEKSLLALSNFTKIYKYKRKLNKCIGVVISKNETYFDINWAYINENWVYNKELEEAVERELEFYGSGVIKEIPRYKFKK